MGSSRNSCSTKDYDQKKYRSSACRPRMLKEFLVDDPSSCSSSGFKSFPRQPLPINSSHQKFSTIPKNNPEKLPRSQSKKLTWTTLSAFQTVIKVVKSMNLITAVVKSRPSILPKNLSRRYPKDFANHTNHEEKVIAATKSTVTVKDIIKWKSFRDLMEDIYLPPLNVNASLNECATIDTNTATTSHSTSNKSSWCDSDFTAEDLLFWNGKLNDLGEKYLPCVSEESIPTVMKAANIHVGSQIIEENQQNSPVSVIDFEVEEDCEESCAAFDRCIVNVERRKQKLMQNIKRFECLAKLDSINIEKWMMSMEESSTSSSEEEEIEELEDQNGNNFEVEEKAWQLLKHVKETTKVRALTSCSMDNIDQVLLDFFRQELSDQQQKRSQLLRYDNEFDCEEMINRTKAWINVDQNSVCSRSDQVVKRREECVRDMERERRFWGSKFGEEQEEIGLGIGNEIVGILVDELLLDVCLVLE